MCMSFKCITYSFHTDNETNNNVVRLVRVLAANTKHLYNICTMLDQRRRHWADVVQKW